MIALGLLFLFWSVGLFLRGQLALRRNILHLEVHDKAPRAAILIPARDESAVIVGLFESLKHQTLPVNPADVYVIVESLDDPTVGLCKQYYHQVVVRTDLSRQCKGAALD